MQSQLEDLEKELLQLNSNQEALKRSFIELIELRQVLTRAEDFFEQVRRPVIVSIDLRVSKKFFYYNYRSMLWNRRMQEPFGKKKVLNVVRKLSDLGA